MSNNSMENIMLDPLDFPSSEQEDIKNFDFVCGASTSEDQKPIIGWETTESSSTCNWYKSSEEVPKCYNSLLMNGGFYTVLKRLEVSKFHKKRQGVIAKCETCNVKIKGSLTVTSNFLKHLKNVHPTVYAEYLNLKSHNQKIPQKYTKDKLNDKDLFNDKVLWFIVDTMSPLSIIEKPSFLKLFAGTNLKVMNKAQCLKLLDVQFENLTRVIRNQISELNYVCITVDIWMLKKRSFFGYTCHWLESDYSRHSIALACQCFSETHSYSRVYELILKINKKFGLTNTQISATITDNGWNFVKDFEEFGGEISKTCCSDDGCDNDCDQIDFLSYHLHQTLPQYYKCASHIINLIATTDFLNALKFDDALRLIHINVMKKCSNLWSKSSQSKSSEIIFETVGIHFSCPATKSWKSLFDSMSKILLKKDKLNEICNDLSIAKFFKNDLSYLEEYCTIMRPLAEALDVLQDEKSTFFGYLIPTIITIKNKFIKMRQSSRIELLNNAVGVLEYKLVERFENIFQFSLAKDAIIAAVLCPSIKFKWLPAMKKMSVDTDENDWSVDVIHKLILEQANADKPEFPDSLDNKSTNKTLSLNTFFDFGDEDSLPGDDADDVKMISKTQLEYYSYLSDQDERIEMLDKYPNIKNLFLRYNVILTASAPVERLFSFVETAHASRTVGLSYNNFEKLVLLKANQNLIMN